MRTLTVFMLLASLSLPVSGCAPLDLLSYPFKSTSKGKAKEAPAASAAGRENVHVEELPPPQ